MFLISVTNTPSFWWLKMKPWKESMVASQLWMSVLTAVNDLEFTSWTLGNDGVARATAWPHVLPGSKGEAGDVWRSDAARAPGGFDRRSIVFCHVICNAIWQWEETPKERQVIDRSIESIFWSSSKGVQRLTVTSATVEVTLFLAFHCCHIMWCY